MEGRRTVLELLERSHGGDRAALDELAERLLPWLHGYVRSRMSAQVRSSDESLDIVQDTFLRVLQRGPAVLPTTEEDALAMLATIACNRMRDRYEWWLVRSGAGECVTRLGHSSTPSRAASNAEEAQLLELAMHLVDPEDAILLHESNWEDLDLAEIAERREISYDAARMRLRAAKSRLGEILKKVRLGDLKSLAPDLPPLDP